MAIDCGDDGLDGGPLLDHHFPLVGTILRKGTGVGGEPLGSRRFELLQQHDIMILCTTQKMVPGRVWKESA